MPEASDGECLHPTSLQIDFRIGGFEAPSIKRITHEFHSIIRMRVSGVSTASQPFSDELYELEGVLEYCLQLGQE